MDVSNFKFGFHV